jgi:hypothetical protein
MIKIGDICEFCNEKIDEIAQCESCGSDCHVQCLDFYLCPFCYEFIDLCEEDEYHIKEEK